ncbi:MAG: flavodoxin family protein [Candidatus Methanomethylophilus sp.]|nr:flavodoxin family protein [Methanomethylophilus sp.]
MRALILNGSARPIGSTGNIVGDIIEELEKGGVETLHVPLYEYHFTPCNACHTCEMRGDGRCMDEADGTNEILDVMRQADIIILAAPGYAGGVPGVMKLFLEKAALVLSKGDRGLHGKYGAAISVAEHDGADATYNELVYWMLHSEMHVIGSCPLTSFKTGFDDYRKDILGLKGLKNLTAHILELAEKE